MARQSARPIDARRRRWNWPHRISRAYRVGVSRVSRFVWNATTSSLLRMFNAANRATAKHRSAHLVRRRNSGAAPLSKNKPRVTAAEVSASGDNRRAGMLVSTGHKGLSRRRLSRRRAGRLPSDTPHTKGFLHFGSGSSDLRLEEFAGDLSHCATTAAVMALIEDPIYGCSMGRKSVAALLDRLASIGASARDAKTLLERVGLRWMQAGPLNCSVFRVRYDPFSDDVRWQHRSAYCISFECWRGRSILTTTADRPVYRCFLLFNAEDELIDWKAG